ncbi:hypothetical protein [Leptolyngbya sp. NIES-2104]|uniref:hypothetical protein n=1 Tax=Leptolyngbya sp. NIES-2104 TaxID=1552121 RepID=UPI0006EC9668|nr:hypothetical protein [Leptolyngbya sp. NIES-2104]GAP99034.1 NB-ARC domain protein [Leptolyngbya sp. NIES-2104]
MSDSPNEFDAVLGNSARPMMGSVVLGGLEGIRQRLKSDRIDQRIAALQQVQHAPAGLDLLVQALNDSAIAVQKVAYKLLQPYPELLQNYPHYRLFECLAALKGHHTGITAIALATQHLRYFDRKVAISASRDGLIQVWDIAAEEATFSIPAYTFVYTISIDTEADIFTIQGARRQIKSWSLKNGQEIDPTEIKLRQIASVTRNNDRYLISGSQNTIKVWDLQAGREICQLKGHQSLVTAVAVSEDQALIVSGSEDRTVRIWGIADQL